MAWIGPEGCRSARSATPKGLDPRPRRPRKCSIRASGKCSIRRFARAGRVSIRAPGAREGCRSMAWIGSEGCRSVRPATPKGLDPRDRAPPEVFDPRFRRLSKCSIRGMEQDGSVRSEPRATAQVFDPRGRAAGCKCSIRTPPGRVSVRSARPDKCSIRRIERPGRVSIHAPATAKGVDSRLGAGRKGVDPHAWRPRGVSIHGVAWPGSVRSSRPATVFQACRPRGATVSPGRAAWRCRATRER